MVHIVSADDSAKINFAPATLAEEVLQNVSMILRTFKNSVPLYRDFGISGTFIDKPLSVAETLIISEIFETVEKYEPRAEIRSIDFEHDELTGKLIPRLEVVIDGE